MSQSSEITSVAGILNNKQILNIEHYQLTWKFTFSEKITLCTDSHWRIIENNELAVSSEDHLQQFGLPHPVNSETKATSLILNESVSQAEVSKHTGDLTINFSNGNILNLIQLSSGYEAWILTTPTIELVCVGGGKIVTPS